MWSNENTQESLSSGGGFGSRGTGLFAEFHCLRLEPREMVQTGLLELVGRSDSDWAGNFATRQSVTGYQCDVQNATMCNRSLKQTAISLTSCEAEFYAASACAGELLGLAESSFSFNMRQIVHYIDIDICTLTQSLPCRWSSLLFVFFSYSAYPQTNTAQLYKTHLDSCTHMDRTGLEFHFVFAKQEQLVHTAILTSYTFFDI